MTLDKRITDFATLVALILVLVTLYTGQRAAALEALKKSSGVTVRGVFEEFVFDVVVLLFTAALFLDGLPIAFEVLEYFHPRSYSGPLRCGYAITWAMLIGLLVWQVVLVCRGACLLKLVRRERSGTTVGADSS